MPVADDRTAALELYAEAQHDPAADWRAIADLLAGVMPRPRLTVVGGLEWGEYAPSLHRGGFAMFRPRTAAEFVFADLTRVVAPLVWRRSKDVPDWARSARVAVCFWRAQHLAGVSDMEAQRMPRLDVPPIILALDPVRGICADPVKASKATEDMRRGVPLEVDNRFSAAARENMRRAQMMRDHAAESRAYLARIDSIAAE